MPRGTLKIVSGGQTGVDRAALHAAMEVGLPVGGWCPQGRLAEDGVIPPELPLKETESRDYAVRTEKNVLDSDATLVVSAGPLQGGTELTVKLALRHGKPLTVIDINQPPDAAAIIRWIRDHDIRVLNVAGPRESNQPGIYAAAKRYLRDVFSQWKDAGGK
ncbi:putative molybdenum carrier protein [Thermopirellula anaerolimosa]